MRQSGAPNLRIHLCKQMRHCRQAKCGIAAKTNAALPLKQLRHSRQAKCGGEGCCFFFFLTLLLRIQRTRLSNVAAASKLWVLRPVALLARNVIICMMSRQFPFLLGRSPLRHGVVKPLLLTPPPGFTGILVPGWPLRVLSLKNADAFSLSSTTSPRNSKLGCRGGSGLFFVSKPLTPVRGFVK